jgi:hypothetical protein
MRPNAAQQFARQVGWQECISRLLVKKPILGQPKQQDSIASIDLQDLPDLMSFDEENLELIAMERPSSPSSVSRISSTVSDAASAIESEIKGTIFTTLNGWNFQKWQMWLLEIFTTLPTIFLLQ